MTTVPHVFTERTWDETAVEAVKTKGSAPGSFVIYCASTTLAEKAAWEFVATYDPEISWDLVVIVRWAVWLRLHRPLRVHSARDRISLYPFHLPRVAPVFDTFPT